MTEKKRIGIFFNETLDAALLLNGARRRHPGAHLVAVISPRAAASFAGHELADEVVQTELSPLRLILKGALFQMVKELRSQRFDLLLLRFPTLKLRLLAALIAPASCEIWLANGTIFPAPVSSLSAAIREYWLRRVSGIKALLRIARSVCCAPVRLNENHPGGNQS